MPVFNAMRKNTSGDKTYWDNSGLKLLVGEYEGKTTYTIIDGRSGQKFSCFPNTPYKDKQEKKNDGDDW